MHQLHRIAIGSVLLLPIVMAALLTGFPAEAGTDKIRIGDQRLVAAIDRTVHVSCKAHTPGSVERSICVAEGRKDAYRAAAEARRKTEPQITYR